MKRNNKWILLLLLFLSITAAAQKKTTKKASDQKQPATKPAVIKKPDVTEDEKKVRDMVSFLEYMLNTLGNSSTPVRDKEVLITESYTKIFRDSKVQVEDDLDEERKVITNKDVVAYLKDVNFFFKNIRFEFTIDDIQNSTTTNGQHFYKVTTTRNLKGITADGKEVNSTQPRYIEINYNPQDQDLKIVSIYTNEYNEKQALLTWWNELSYEWKSIFKKKFNLNDSVSLNDIKNIIYLDELDISNNLYILNIDPLHQLLNLKSLALSGLNVSDLTPIRNLTELVELNISGTKIKDLSPLKYALKLEKLRLRNTEVIDISVVEKMKGLRSLDVRGTQVIDFTPVTTLLQLQWADLSQTQISSLSHFKNLTQLAELNLSGTPIMDISQLKDLQNLEVLDLDSTRIKDINALGSVSNLRVLHISYTDVSALTSIQKLTHLEKIYCDQSLIKRETADSFMIINPNVLVILDSKDLKQWWDTLPQGWPAIFLKTPGKPTTPTREEMVKITLLDSINIAGLSHINSLEPLRKLLRLKVIIANNTRITDLSPLVAHKEIQYLDISETEVADLSTVTHFKELNLLKANHTKIENVESLSISSLKLFQADLTSVNDLVAKGFLERNPTCLIIYKSNQLNRWWSTLSESWKEVFSKQMKIVNEATSENLHRLIEQEALHFKDAAVNNLSPLSEFIRLKELHFSGATMTRLSPIENIKSLKSLHATKSPIDKLDSLDHLALLEELDISDTPVDDIYIVWKLKNLKSLNCSGTQIKRLDALEKLENLEMLDFSNTNVSKLDPLDYLPLKTLKCFNTKVSGRAIENFKASHPDCKVVYYR